MAGGDDEEQEAKRKRRRDTKWEGMRDHGGETSEPAPAQTQALQPPMHRPIGISQYDAVDQFRAAGARHLRARVYIGNVDVSVSEREILQIFSTFGNVVNVHMPREGTRSQGFCFIEYDNQNAANLAISRMQNFVIGGRLLRVNQPTEQRRPQVSLPGVLTGPPAAQLMLGMETTMASPTGHVPNSELRRISISGIPTGCEASEIKSIFQPFGTVVRCDMVAPSTTAPACKPGFTSRVLVEYASEQSAYGALRALQGFTLNGGGMHLQLGSPGSTASEVSAAPALPSVPMSVPVVQEKPVSVTTSKMVCLENLVGPGEADEDLADEVREECNHFGKVERVTVQEFGEKKNVRVYVTFKDSIACGKAIQNMNGRWFGGRQVKAAPYTEEVIL